MILFNEDVPSLSHGYILNETAVKALNLTNPVGTRGSSTLDGDGEIIGVIKDFHFSSLHSLIEPLVIEYLNNEQGRQIGIGYIRKNSARTVQSSHETS